MTPSIFEYDRRDVVAEINRRERVYRTAILVLQIGVTVGIISLLLEWAIINPTSGL